MRCPVDGETLVMADRSGVEIDYCPKCRGVWLDRGELDKIIDRSLGLVAQAPAPVPPQPPNVQQAGPIYQPEPRAPHHSDDDRRRHKDDDDDYRRGYKKKRRDSFLSDIFDF
ncbi:TFIIB-type zinc ribbon-containing protein [Tabrizicola caldifontis]|uniref:TFIIB-type zinc ribbon-containing protein n=1 Tax=Tabrizicola caldifontis TaxID=2528036 RepID=UPI001082186D|nr:zf-TFIIB domain-containing protein [Rhodobacter sp. YIM 73028]